MHLEGSSYASFNLMKEAINELDLQVFVNGGDQANNGVGAPKTRTLQQIRNMMSGFWNIRHKMMNVMGNHDDNSISRLWEETMKHPELKSELFDYMGDASVRGPSGKYHYRDDTTNKIRYIALDSIDIPYVKSGDGLKYIGIHEFAYRQEQLRWFANTALNTPTGYSVVVFSHTPPYRGSIRGFDKHTRNADMARGILKAYKEKTVYNGSSASGTESDFTASVNVDFTGKGGDVIAWFSGHVHYDNVQMAPEGFQIITTLNDSAQPWSDAPKRTLGTTTESAFDIVTVNKDERNIYLTRVGAGQDRVVKY